MLKKWIISCQIDKITKYLIKCFLLTLKLLQELHIYHAFAICNIGLSKKLHCHTKWYRTWSKWDQILESKKLFLFDHSLPFMVLTKSGTNFGHFAGTIDDKMKPKGILHPKRPYFLSYFTAMPILNKLWAKMCRNITRSW